MARVLIVYASTHGQTRKIADAIAERLRDLDHVADLADVERATTLPTPIGYDAVMLGSRIQIGRHARALGAYVRRHRALLAAMPTAFFSVSMSAATPGAGPDPKRYMERFFVELGWHPRRAIAFAGGLPYTRYDRVTRFVMKMISRAAGHTTDTSRDHVFTDWREVERFADELHDDLAAIARIGASMPHASA